jgi:hypothetical protein
MATGHGQYLQSIDPDTIDMFPAWELIRVIDSRVKRDWTTRWADAAASAGDPDAQRMLDTHGRMIARKDSPIWTALSRFGRPHPPFDFNSGMDVEDVDRDSCVELGLIRAGDRIAAPDAQPAPPPTAGISGLHANLRATLMSSLGPGYRMDADGVLHEA